MSEKPVPIVLDDETAELIADHMVSKFMDRLSDPDTVAVIMDVWTKQGDQRLGRAIRRSFLWITGALLLFVAMRYNVLEAGIKNLLKG
jgi:hypothetical protein